MQVSCVPVDMMPAGPPAAPASAPAGQESLFASRLKTATEKQSSCLPIEAPGNQAGNAPDGKQASATDHVERTEGQRKTATPEISLNGSAGAALLQPAAAPNAEVTIVDTLAASGGNLSALQRNVETSLYGLAETALQPAAVGSKVGLTPIAGDSNVGFSSALVSESAVAKMLGALTTTEAPAGPQKNSAALATQPAEGTQPAISPGNLEATVAQTPAAAFAPSGQSALISGQSTISDSETSAFHFENFSQAAANTTTAMTLQASPTIAEAQRDATLPLVHLTGSLTGNMPETMTLQPASTSQGNTAIAVAQRDTTLPLPQLNVSLAADSNQAADLTPQQTANTSPANPIPVAGQVNGQVQNGPLIVQNQYGQNITIYQTAETEEETVNVSSTDKTNLPVSESRHLDVNSNSIRSHLPNGTSPEATAEGDDRQQDTLTKSRQQEAIKFTESTREGVVSDDQLISLKGQSNLNPDNQPLLFALQRNNGQVSAGTATMDSASSRLPAGSTVPDTAVVDQMIAQLATNKRLESGTVNLKLHPQELGELRMEIRVEQENIKAHIIAQTPQAQEMIDRHMPRLREALEQQGLKLQYMEVTVAAQDTTGGESYQERSSWQQPNPSRHHSASDQPIFTLETDENSSENHSAATTLSVLA